MRHTYANPREKRTDFWIAFVAFFVVNIAAIGLLNMLTAAPTGTGKPSANGAGVALALTGSLLLVNLAAPIILAFTRPYAALGILVAFAASMWLAVVEGVFFTVSDFVAFNHSSSLSAANYGFLAAGFIVASAGAFFVIRSIVRGIR